MKVDVPIVRCTVCNAPYVLRFSLRISAGAEWLYQRDCKHKTGLPAGTLDVAAVETAPLTVLDQRDDELREQLLEAFGTDDIAAIARGFDKGARSLSDASGGDSPAGTEES